MTSTPTDIPNLSTANDELTAADTHLEQVRAGIEAGTVTDASELEAAETRRRFAFMRRTGAATRAAQNAREARKTLLDEFANRLRAYAGTKPVDAAYATFEADVDKALAKFATTIGNHHAAVTSLTNEAHQLEIPGTGTDSGDSDPRERENGLRLFGDRLSTDTTDAGPAANIELPYPVEHSRTKQLLERRANDAIARLTRGI